MCIVGKAKIIKTKVKKFLQRRKMFTSVDIANAIKLSGAWVADTVVAKYLRNNAISIAREMSIDCLRCTIPVTLSNGTPTQTYLYYPMGLDPDKYTETHQKALDPTESQCPKTTSVHIRSIPTQTSDFPDLSKWRVDSV